MTLTDFLVWKFCGNAKFPQNFKQFATQGTVVILQYWQPLSIARTFLRLILSYFDLSKVDFGDPS